MPFLPLLSLLALVVASAACTPDTPETPPADLVLTNGKVITVDESLGIQEAIAVRGSRIVAVGSTASIGAYIGEGTQVMDLQGKTVIPGLIEGHGHFLGLGRAQQILDLNAARQFEDIVAQVGVAADSAQPGEWIFGRGWHQDKWAHATELPPDALVDGVPRHDALSAVSPDNPVYLTHASGHAVYVNRAALRAAGIDQATADPEGGTIVRDAAGRATGLLRENAQLLVDRAVQEDSARLSPEAKAADFRERVRLAGAEALRFGITSFHDAGTPFDDIDQLKMLEAAQELPVRLYVMVLGPTNEELAARLSDYYMPAADNDFLAVRSIKRQLDGALGAHGAWLLEPYVDMPDTTGLLLTPIAEVEAAAAIALEQGFQVNTHAIGTRANRETLDLYERVWQATGADGGGLRWRIEHAQHIHPADIPRFGKLGVIAAVQGVHCTSDGPWIPTRLGDARTRDTSYRWRDLLDSGARLNNGTDAPVESLDPFASLYASVARRMPDGRAFYPEQAMTRMEALRSYTLDNAYSAFEEDLKGSISVGKLADLAVLSRDLLDVPAEEIPGTEVLYTILGGEVVYAAEP